MANPVIVGHSTPECAKNSGLGINLPKKCLSLNNVLSKTGLWDVFFGCGGFSLIWMVVVLVVENGEAGCFLFLWRLDPQIGETRLK